MDIDDELKPDPSITKEVFRAWQEAKRGSRPAENLTNPAWEWLVRCGINPYRANLLFETGPTFPPRPRWTADRMGQTVTRLADGREILVAGEHEDHYDPDFFIYNDVIVRHPDDRIEIFGYPASAFVPTDFHTATAIENERSILLIGNLGYPDDRRPGETQTLRLDTTTLLVEPFETTGEAPGWIHSHDARSDADGGIVLTGGKILSGDDLIENFDEWRLDLADRRWTRLTRRRWPRAVIERSDGEMLHLFDYFQFQMQRRFPQIAAAVENFEVPEILKNLPTLAEKLGMEPDLALFERLYVPARPSRAVETDLERDSWNTKRFEVDGVTVRFVEGFSEVAMTVEGTLPFDVISELVEEYREKLSRLENAECAVRWIDRGET